ncbi:MAG TPA: hypothetical protein PKH31_13760 [Candidatus Sumerlaeota bacterium]|nr:hypothetical protein [Candidatus Sumerlaeota bacterium]
MRRDILKEISFLCVILMLGSGWIAVQLSAYHSQYPGEHPCRVLDIQLSQIQPVGSPAAINRIAILTDREPQYQIESPQTGVPLRVHLNRGDIAPELEKRIENLDGAPMVQNLKIHPETNGPLTVELQLAQTGIQIADSLIHTPRQHGLVVDLIPSTPQATDGERDTQLAALPLESENASRRGIAATVPTASPSPKPSTRLLQTVPQIPRLILASASQMLSLPCP